MEYLPLPLLRRRELHYHLHDNETGWLKGERHDPDRIPPEVVEQIRRWALAGRGEEFVRKQTGMAWRTIDQLADKHGITFRRNKRGEDRVAELKELYGGLNQLIEVLRGMREHGMGWHRIGKAIGLNHYSCKVLVEEGRVPSRCNCGRKPRAGSP